MNRSKKIFFVTLVLILEIIFVLFVSIMGFYEFRDSYKGIREELYKFRTLEQAKIMGDSLNFGKDIEHYYGATDILDELKESFGEEFELFITAEDKILYTTVDNLPNYNNKFEVEIVNNKNEIKGYINVYYSDEAIDRELLPIRNDLKDKILYGLIILLIFTTILLAILFSQKLSLKKINIIVLVVILLAMALESGYSIYVFQDNLSSEMKSESTKIVDDIGKKMNTIFNEGVNPENIDEFSRYLGKKNESIEIIDNFKVFKLIADSNVYYEVSENEKVLETEKISINYYMQKDNLVFAGTISEDFINRSLESIILTIGAILIVSLIIVVELFNTLEIFIYRISDKYNIKSKETSRNIATSLKLGMFLCALAEYISLPYSAMLIRQMNIGVWGLSVGMTAALPIVVEGIAQVLTTMVSSKIINKFRLKITLIIAIIIMIFANFSAFIANTPLEIIISRAIAGVAYATVAQVLNYIIVNSYNEHEERREFLTAKNAGLIAGISTGASVGAIIANVASYQMTYLFAIGIFMLFLIMFMISIPWKFVYEMTKNKDDEEKVKKDKSKIKLKHVFNPSVMVYVVFSLLPLTVALSFIVTLIPNVIQKNNIPTIVLSYCYIVNGLLAIYIAPMIVKMFNKSKDGNRGLILAMLIGSCALFALELPVHSFAVLISSALLGLLDGVGTPFSADLFITINTINTKMEEYISVVLLNVYIYIFSIMAPIIAELMNNRVDLVSGYTISGFIFVQCAIISLAIIHSVKQKSINNTN